MARGRGRLSDEAALLQSEKGLNLAKIQEIANSGRRDDQKLRLMEKELADKVQMTQQEIGSRQKIAETEAGSRRDVANIDVASRNRTANLDLATKLLDQVRLAKDSDKKSQTDFLSDISRMPGMKPEDVAGTAAEMGNPAMMNALNKSKANLIDNQIRSMIPGYVKASPADKLKQEAQANLLDPNAGKRLSALAYPATAGGPPTELSLRQVTPTAATAPVPAGTSTDDVVSKVLKTAFGGGEGGEPTRTASGGGGAQLPFTSMTTPERAAAGYPVVSSGRVLNQPAGTAGLDYNVSTGEWIPQSNEGTINGLPSSQAVAEAAMRTGKAPVYSSDKTWAAYQALKNTPNIAELGRHGVASMVPAALTPETTTGQPITPNLTPAPGGGVQISARPDANQYGAPIGPPVGPPSATFGGLTFNNQPLPISISGEPPGSSEQARELAAQRAAAEARRRALEEVARQQASR